MIDARHKSDVLIVGGGPAGMAAAYTASQNGARVTIVDDNPNLGGQIWRQEHAKQSSKDAAIWFERIRSAKFDLLCGTRIISQPCENVLLAETLDGVCELAFSKLVLATGARERFLPFPGWTLPNVMGAGGLQALVKNGLPIEKKRVVVAGTGPLLLAVAAYLKKRGAKVLLIAEQTSQMKLLKFTLHLSKQPGKVVQAIALRQSLLSVPYKTNCYPIAANGIEKLESVRLKQGNKTFGIECDYLACGFHLLPNTELAALLGCKLGDDGGGAVTVDEWQQTSVSDVFAVGEATGVGGVELALVEGQIAGYAATESKDMARALFSKRQRLRRFARLLNEAFALREELKHLVQPDTILCRCEDVTFERVTRFSSWREAKLQTRCGMGPCQGRICGAAAEFLFGWRVESVRPPIMPVRLDYLAQATVDERE
jgi:NADPH-dependent 2,4-dienoyl-CoA reductase/sulfur reductase-like enzyme